MLEGTAGNTQLLVFSPISKTVWQKLWVASVSHPKLMALFLRQNPSVDFFTIAGDCRWEKIVVMRLKRNLRELARASVSWTKCWRARLSGVARAPQAPRPRGGGGGLKGPAMGPPGRSSCRKPLAWGPHKLFEGRRLKIIATPLARFEEMWQHGESE